MDVSSLIRSVVGGQGSSWGIQCQGSAVEESDRDKAPEKGTTDRKMSEQSMFGDGSGTANAESAAPRPLSHVFAALNALG